MPTAKAGRNGASRAASDPTNDLLRAAVEETARLLEADGAMVYLVDETTGNLRFAHDAGIKSKRSRDIIRGVVLEPGTGMFGRAVAERAVVLTEDYANDPSFPHASGPDRVVADMGIRSMVVAPLRHGDEVYGALGAFSKRLAAFDPARIALVRSLADHAAAAIANTRLIAALDESSARLADRAEVERTAARDQRPHLGRVRPVRRPAARGRRGRPPAQGRRRADRPRRPPLRPAALGLRLGCPQARRHGLAGRPRRDGSTRACPARRSPRGVRSGPATTPTTRASRMATAPTATST